MSDFLAERDRYARLADEKQARVRTVEAEYLEVIGKLVDDPDGRAALLRKRTLLAGEADALGDELRELARRRDAAELGHYESLLAAADARVNELKVIATAKRHALDAALLAFQRFLNAGGRAPIGAEAQAERVRLETERAKALSEGQIARADLERAGNARLRAWNDLQAARLRLGVPV